MEAKYFCQTCKDQGEIEGGIGPLGEIEWLDCPDCDGVITRKRMEQVERELETVTINGQAFHAMEVSVSPERPAVPVIYPRLPKGQRLGLARKKKKMQRMFNRLMAAIHPRYFRHGRPLKITGFTKSSVWHPPGWTPVKIDPSKFFWQQLPPVPQSER